MSFAALSNEIHTTTDGKKLAIARDAMGAKYEVDGKSAYNTDAGALLSGILVWGQGVTDVFLPLGGRRGERTMVRVPRFVVKEIALGQPVRVFFQRVGDLWAVERPGKALVVRDGKGQVLELARIDGGSLGRIEAERPWASLGEEQHVGRIALWAQIYAVLGATSDERALAEDVRTAALFATDFPSANLARVLDHVAVRGRDLCAWRPLFARARALAKAA